LNKLTSNWFKSGNATLQQYSIEWKDAIFVFLHFAR